MVHPITCHEGTGDVEVLL